MLIGKKLSPSIKSIQTLSNDFGISIVSKNRVSDGTELSTSIVHKKEASDSQVYLEMIVELLQQIRMVNNQSGSIAVTQNFIKNELINKVKNIININGGSHSQSTINAINILKKEDTFNDNTTLDNIINVIGESVKKNFEINNKHKSIATNNITNKKFNQTEAFFNTNTNKFESAISIIKNDSNVFHNKSNYYENKDFENNNTFFNSELNKTVAFNNNYEKNESFYYKQEFLQAYENSQIAINKIEQYKDIVIEKVNKDVVFWNMTTSKINNYAYKFVEQFSKSIIQSYNYEIEKIFNNTIHLAYLKKYFNMHNDLFFSHNDINLKTYSEENSMQKNENLYYPKNIENINFQYSNAIDSFFSEKLIINSEEFKSLQISVAKNMVTDISIVNAFSKAYSNKIIKNGIILNKAKKNIFNTFSKTIMDNFEDVQSLYIENTKNKSNTHNKNITSLTYFTKSENIIENLEEDSNTINYFENMAYNTVNTLFQKTGIIVDQNQKNLLNNNIILNKYIKSIDINNFAETTWKQNNTNISQENISLNHEKANYINNTFEQKQLIHNINELNFKEENNKDYSATESRNHFDIYKNTKFLESIVFKNLKNIENTYLEKNFIHQSNKAQYSIITNNERHNEIKTEFFNVFNKENIQINNQLNNKIENKTNILKQFINEQSSKNWTNENYVNNKNILNNTSFKNRVDNVINNFISLNTNELVNKTFKTIVDNNTTEINMASIHQLFNKNLNNINNDFLLNTNTIKNIKNSFLETKNVNSSYSNNINHNEYEENVYNQWENFTKKVSGEIKNSVENNFLGFNIYSKNIEKINKLIHSNNINNNIYEENIYNQPKNSIKNISTETTNGVENNFLGFNIYSKNIDINKKTEKTNNLTNVTNKRTEIFNSSKNHFENEYNNIFKKNILASNTENIFEERKNIQLETIFRQKEEKVQTISEEKIQKIATEIIKAETRNIVEESLNKYHYNKQTEEELTQEKIFKRFGLIEEQIEETRDKNKINVDTIYEAVYKMIEREIKSQRRRLGK